MSGRTAPMHSGCLPLIVSYHGELETGAVPVKVNSHRYEISEANPVIRSNIIIALQKVVSEGLPFPDTDARTAVADTGKRDMPSRQPGKPVIRWPQAMKSRYDQPEENELARREGPLYPGTVAAMSKHGRFFLVDRNRWRQRRGRGGWSSGLDRPPGLHRLSRSRRWRVVGGRIERG